MDMFEEARALAVTMKMRKMSQSELAKTLNVSQSFVANKLRLLKLDTNMQDQILQYRLTERHARALLRLENKEDRQRVLDRVCEEGLSVARTEALVDLLKMSEQPMMAGLGERLGLIDAFIDSTKRSLDSIRTRGATATSKISYENHKVYISICIDENG